MGRGVTLDVSHAAAGSATGFRVSWRTAIASPTVTVPSQSVSLWVAAQSEDAIPAANCRMRMASTGVTRPSQLASPFPKTPGMGFGVGVGGPGVGAIVGTGVAVGVGVCVGAGGPPGS